MQLEIRIINASGIDFDSVVVVYPDRDEVQYGRIPKGTASDFARTTRAYRYATIRAKAGERDYLLQPIDYVGERQLAPGRYSYVLRVQAGRLICELESAD
ncbi:MAG: hypothetical protein ACYC0X_03265 [Pirellulaceae bacterium]